VAECEAVLAGGVVEREGGAQEKLLHV
jgi:hypothetical protein